MAHFGPGLEMVAVLAEKEGRRGFLIIYGGVRSRDTGVMGV